MTVSTSPDKSVTDRKAAGLDATGIGLSFLCVAHCLLIPTAAAALPMMGAEVSEIFGVSHEWHLALFVLAAPISILGLGWGTRIAKAGWRTFVVGLLGLALMAVGISHLFDQMIETILTLTGVSVLAGAHIANWRSRKTAGHNHERDCGMCENHTHSA